MNESSPPRPASHAKRPYSKPDFTRHDLRLITRGGTPGINDSSPANTEPQGITADPDGPDSSF
ncbi:MAG: hypothetical protein ABR550_06625 [Wenzhouxiangellaceae bacterium]